MMEKKKVSIGYFADGPWAHLAFKKIMQDQSLAIKFICVRNDKRDAVLCRYAQENGIDLLYTPNINADDFVEKMKKYACDLFVSMSFDQIFREKMIHLPPFKTINCHAGKLPFYRGRNILNWVLINDEKEFGITVHYVDPGIDTGDIILQDTYEISDFDTYATLLERAYEGCADILYRAIKQIQAGEAIRIRQDSIDAVGLYCGQRREGDEIINWNQTSRNIFNFIRALTAPGIGATSYLDGKEIKILESKMIKGARSYINIPGQILNKDREGLIVKTQDTIIKVTKYEFGGKIRVGQRMGGQNDRR